jgi:hypothetical protein
VNNSVCLSSDLFSLDRHNRAKNELAAPWAQKERLHFGHKDVQTGDVVVAFSQHRKEDDDPLIGAKQD